MDPFGEVLIVEDLIECDAEESVDNPNATWTEQALDMFISQLQSVTKHTFASEREMLQVVTNKMSSRNYTFTLDQIEYKYNSLRQMYREKKEKNQEIELELVKLFGGAKSKRQDSNIQQDDISPKRIKMADVSNSSQYSRSGDEETAEEKEKYKMIWSTTSNRIFLDLLEEHRPYLGSKFKTKKQMWVEISKRLKAKGFELSWHQVANKWKYLVRHYRTRLEMMRKDEKIQPTNGYPEVARKSKSPKKFKQDALDIISFANDQKLPFDDDEDDDEYNNADGDNNDEDDEFEYEQKFSFEEPCTIPEINLLSPKKFEPVNVDEPLTKLENHPSIDPTYSNFDNISRELAYLRSDMRIYQTETMAIKKQQLELFKQQNAQFNRIGDALQELLTHFRRRDDRK